MANVQFESLRKSYGDNVVVKHVDLEIDDGEFLVLLGPSGCGKSTILRMLAGLESITDGSIKIGDKVVNDLDPAERDIAFVFQNYALYPHMTVKENITFCLKNMRLPKDEIEKRLQEAAKVVELEDLLDRLPGELSGGQRQRVAIGRTIVRRSKVLLMDEPLSNLDAKLRGAMRAQISRIQDDLGVTTVYVTHDQIEAMTMADRIVVLHDGVVQQVGKPMEIYQKPVNRFVAGFIGSPSMNFVDVEVQEDGDTLRVKASGVNVPLSSEISKRLAGYVGETIIMGFRPQGVEAATEAGAFFTGIVEVVEPYGPETYITLKLGDKKAIGRLSPEDNPIKGESFGLTTKVESLFFFDPANDAAIR